MSYYSYCPLFWVYKRCVCSPVASVVVRHGTLECGAVLVAGRTWGKVRAMFDERRKPMREAPPSTPVLTVGWRDLPTSGDNCLQVLYSMSFSCIYLTYPPCRRLTVSLQHVVWSNTELPLLPDYLECGRIGRVVRVERELV